MRFKIHFAMVAVCLMFGSAVIGCKARRPESALKVAVDNATKTGIADSLFLRLVWREFDGQDLSDGPGNLEMQLRFKVCNQESPRRCQPIKGATMELSALPKWPTYHPMVRINITGAAINASAQGLDGTVGHFSLGVDMYEQDVLVDDNVAEAAMLLSVIEGGMAIRLGQKGSKATAVVIVDRVYGDTYNSSGELLWQCAASIKSALRDKHVDSNGQMDALFMATFENDDDVRYFAFERNLFQVYQVEPEAIPGSGMDVATIVGTDRWTIPVLWTVGPTGKMHALTGTDLKAKRMRMRPVSLDDEIKGRFIRALRTEMVVARMNAADLGISTAAFTQESPCGQVPGLLAGIME